MFYGKSLLTLPSAGGGVEHFARGVDQRIADGGGYIAAALAPHGNDGGHAVPLTGGKQRFLAFHHVHKAHRHPDDEGGPQPGGLNEFRDGQQGSGGVAHGKDGARMLGSGPVHGGHGTGGARLLCGFGHGRVGHVAHGFASKFAQAGLGDTRQRHVGVGDDGRAALQSFDGGWHRTRGEAQILCIIEIGRGVDDPLDHGGGFRRRGQAQLFQLGCDDGKARPLDVGGQMMLRGHTLSPFRMPMAA